MSALALQKTAAAHSAVVKTRLVQRTNESRELQSADRVLTQEYRRRVQERSAFTASELSIDQKENLLFINKLLSIQRAIAE